jgi:hypothetical protein
MMEKGKVINYVDVHIRMLYLAKYIYLCCMHHFYFHFIFRDDV